jgi:hypothetical protein
MSADETRCKKCAKIVNPGDWPFCPHESIWQGRALAAQPTIVYKNAKGECYFPAGPNAKPPKGYERHELRTLQERDKFEHEINAKESAKLREQVYRDREEWSAQYSAQRVKLDEVREDLRRSGYEPKLIDHIMRHEQERERQFDKKLKQEANFYIESSHFDGIHFHDE